MKTNSAPEAIAWDVDGTLVDSEPLHFRALKQVCVHHGVDISDFGHAPFVGVAIADVWRTIGGRFLSLPPKEAEATFYQSVTNAYLAGLGALEARPGAQAVIQTMAAKGAVQCAVSNSESAIVHPNLQQLGVAAQITFSVCLGEAAQPKPDPAPYLRACELLGLPAAQVMAVEDSRTGLQSAKSAGLISVLYTAEPNWQEWADQADHVLHRLEDLPSLFEKLGAP